MPKRECIVAGNWKMYKTGAEAMSYVEALVPQVKEAPVKVYIAVPFTALRSAMTLAKGTNVVIGAQNMSDATEGAFTGEIAAKMLTDLGVQFVLLGHSERRHIFGEDDAFINRKVKKALEEGLQPIFCVGETKKEREAEQTKEVLERQIKEGLVGLTPDQLIKTVIAYEPVWAIGTGLTATPQMAQEAHVNCRAVLAEMFEAKIASQVSILYGGSVKPDNAQELLRQPDVDGALVGGAALDPDSFAQIVEAGATANKTK